MMPMWHPFVLCYFLASSSSAASSLNYGISRHSVLTLLFSHSIYLLFESSHPGPKLRYHYLMIIPRSITSEVRSSMFLRCNKLFVSKTKLTTSFLWLRICHFIDQPGIWEASPTPTFPESLELPEAWVLFPVLQAPRHTKRNDFPLFLMPSMTSHCRSKV